MYQALEERSVEPRWVGVAPLFELQESGGGPGHEGVEWYGDLVLFCLNPLVKRLGLQQCLSIFHILLNDSCEPMLRVEVGFDRLRFGTVARHLEEGGTMAAVNR